VIPKKASDMLAKLDAANMHDRADELRDTMKSSWRSFKENELDGARTLAVASYVRAVLVARASTARLSDVGLAVRRLLFLTDIVGDAKMKSYVETTKDPIDVSRNVAYTPGMFARWRVGLLAVPPSSGVAPPLPMAP
jgi:hypothetical protein